MSEREKADVFHEDEPKNRTTGECQLTLADPAAARRLFAAFQELWRNIKFVRGSANAKWCPGAESNHRHHDFQSCALPTELPGRRAGPDGLLSKARGVIEARIHTVQNACSAPGALWLEADRG